MREATLAKLGEPASSDRETRPRYTLAAPGLGWDHWVGLGWARLGWVGLGWARLGWVGLAAKKTAIGKTAAPSLGRCPNRREMEIYKNR